MSDGEHVGESGGEQTKGVDDDPALGSGSGSSDNTDLSGMGAGGDHTVYDADGAGDHSYFYG